MNNIVGKKIELLPVTPQANEVLCPTCGGIGWLEDEENHCITTCTNPLCNKGVIRCCPVCGEPYKSRYSTHCESESCVKSEYLERKKREIQAEQERFNKAQKIRIENVPKELKDAFYSDHYDYNEGYCYDLDWIEDLPEDERPKYVWSTTKTELYLDAENIVSQACEDLHEDAFDNVEDLNGLQKLLNAWCDKQSGTGTYWVNYKLALLI